MKSPNLFFILGDFNAHNILRDARGRRIEQLLYASSLFLLNKKKPTYFIIANTSHSSIALSISLPSLLADFKWNFLKTPYVRDYFSIILSAPNEGQPFPEVSRWKLHSADWERYETLTCTEMSTLTIDDAVAYFTAFVIDAASNGILKTRRKSSNRRVLCWNDGWRKARMNQNKAWALLRSFPAVENLENFRQVRL